MMKATLFFCCVCLTLAGALFGQDATTDDHPELRGWSSARWGMNLAELRAAFPAARPIDPPQRNLGALQRLRAAGVAFGPVQATAAFEFDPNADRLVAVTLDPDPAISATSAFSQLRAALVEKYGTPASEGTATHRTASGSVLRNRVVQWRMKHTTVTLTWYGEGDPVGMVAARYSERKSDSSL